MHGLMAVGCAAGALLVAGCGGSDSTGGGAGTSGPSTTGGAEAKLVNTLPAATKPVDTVTWALPTGEPPTMDPMKSGTESGDTILANLCEHILSVNPDFSIGEGLATQADWTDPTTFVIDLRPGVTFWDGTPLTADDVVYSLQREMDPKAQSVYAGAFMFIAKIDKTGPRQVTLHFKVHDAQFRNVIAGPAGVVLERAYTEKAGAALGTPGGGLQCTGPFKLVKWAPGDRITIARNDAYWGQKAQVGTIDFRFLTDSSTLTSALLSGEIDGAYGAPVTSSSALDKADAGQVFLGPSTTTVSLGPVQPSGPSADPRVRTALDLAIDKQAFVANVLRGQGQTVKTFTPPLVWTGLPGRDIYQAGYDALADPITDLEKAKALIAEAKPRKTLVFAVPAGDALMAQTATIAQAAAKSLGFDAQIRQLQGTEFASLFYDPSKRAGIDFIVTTGYVEVPGALYYAPQFVLKQGLFNWTQYDNPEASKDLIGAQASMDPDQTAKLFVDAQKLFAPDRLQISLGLAYQRLFLNDRLTGAVTSQAYLSSPWAAHLGGK